MPNLQIEDVDQAHDLVSKMMLAWGRESLSLAIRAHIFDEPKVKQKAVRCHGALVLRLSNQRLFKMLHSQAQKLEMSVKRSCRYQLHFALQ
jgi:hypothetical protein